MSKYVISIDGGKEGALSIWHKEKGIWIPDRNIIDFDAEQYKKIFEKYKGSVVIVEYVSTIYSCGGAYATMLLKSNIEFTKGLAYGLCKIYENGNTSPNSWKSCYEGLKQPKGEKPKWDNETKKEKAVLKAKELYPDIDIPLERVIHKKDGTERRKYKDGRADTLLMGNAILNIKKIDINE